MMKIKLEKFEGPLALLLQIIEKEEMDITEISLAKIANQYLEYLKSAPNINPEEMTDFLVVAAKLLLIKSRALLPYLYPEEEEEIKELEEQLKMYKEFLEAAKKIEALVGKNKFMFARQFSRRAIISASNIFSPPQTISPGALHDAFRDLLGKIKPQLEQLGEEKINDKVSIEDKIKIIKNLLLSRARINFKRFLSDAESKTDIIVSFLAVLELVKQKSIFIKQNELFGDIEINKI